MKLWMSVFIFYDIMNETKQINRKVFEENP